MKLRIDPEKISFRLDFDELEILLREGVIQDSTPLPESHLKYKVITLTAGSKATFQATNGAYILSLPRDVVEAHKATLPSLKGIVTAFPCQNGDLLVSLEINLKKKLKHSLER
ncbi:MAG: hypothetical protein JKY59_02130 [Emcibacter sp.]|nr:hypothetical protein [Emcibacter sp.]